MSKSDLELICFWNNKKGNKTDRCIHAPMHGYFESLASLFFGFLFLFLVKEVKVNIIKQES